MAERHVDERSRHDGMRGALKRRGLLAGAAVMAAGLLARQATDPQPVGATSGTGTDGAVIMGSNFANSTNKALNPTIVQRGATWGGGSMFVVEAISSTNNFTDNVNALFGHGTGQTGIGVEGFSGNTAGATPTTGPVGVHGFGAVNNSRGVFGDSPGNGSIGVYGQATGVGGIGVAGQSDAGSSSIGVRGTANLGIGVSGASNGNAGVFGTTTAAGFSGLAGIVSTPNTAAFAGTATVPTAFAGFFTGDVFVNGNFTVLDPTKKHGAIAHPDGSHRILYSMESPEAWLEDFGEGKLVNGKADVKLDLDFAAVVHTDRYLVFLTSFDAQGEGLAVTARRADGFTVQERKGGTSGQAFGWRVVVKPKTENKAERLAKFTVPEIKVPNPPPWPTPTAAPQAQPPATRPSPPATGAQGEPQANVQNPVQPIPPSRP